MKKIFVLILLLLVLTGCGRKKCDYNIENILTENYSEDALKCKKVTYTSEKFDFQFITTPNKNGDAFLAEIMFKGAKFDYSYFDTEFVNVKIRRNIEKDVMFLELYNNRKNGNIYLVVMDLVGNIKYEIPNTSSPSIKGNNFIIKEYLRFADDEYLCEDYNIEDIAYREVTYNIASLDVVNSKDIKIKEICK